MALLGTRELALVAFPACGFFASVMWSVIFSLALNSVEKQHGPFSGILPLIVGALADSIGLKGAMLFLMFPLLYICYIGFWAKPLVANATISIKNNKE